MRNYVKAIVTFVFLMAAVAFVPSVSDAAGVPGNLRQTGADSDEFTVSWDAVPSADDYYTTWSMDGMNWSKAEKTYGDPKETIWNLSAGKTYYVRVCSFEEGSSWLSDTDDIYSAWSAPFEVVTAPDASEMKPVQVTSTLDTSISLTWTAATGATSYELKNNYANDALYLTTTVPSATIGGLAPGTWYGIDIYPCRTSASGYKAYSARLHNYLKTAGSSLPTVNPGTVVAPKTPGTSNFGISNASSSSGMVSFYATDPNRGSNGYEVEVRKLSGNKRVKTVSSASTYSGSVKFSKNTPYKYRVRLYAVSGTTKLYSGWSSYRYFCIQKVTGKNHYRLSSKYSTIKLKWGKVTGAKGYTIYMSTSRNGKYKKVKSLSKKAKSVTLTKYGKSRLRRSKTYYVKVVPKLKDGKKTIKNDTQLINYSY